MRKFAVEGFYPGRLLQIRQQRVGAGVARVDGQRTLQKSPRLPKALHSVRRHEGKAGIGPLQVVVVRLPAVGWLGPRALDLGPPDMRGEKRHDRVRYFVLDGKHVLDLAVIALGPAKAVSRAQPPWPFRPGRLCRSAMAIL